MDFLTNFLKSLIEGFRVKNPKAFAVLAVVTLSGVYVADVATRQEVCQVIDGVQFCEPLLKEAAQKVVVAAERVLVFIALLLGVSPMQKE